MPSRLLRFIRAGRASWVFAILTCLSLAAVPAAFAQGAAASSEPAGAQGASEGASESASEGTAQGAAEVAGEVVTFARAVELATDASSVRTAEAQLELANLSLQSALYPVSATATGGLSTNTDFTGDGTTLGLDVSVNASLRLGWGSSGDSIAAARRTVEAAEAAVLSATSDAVQQAVRLYSDALAAVDARDVARLQVDVAKLQADAAHARLAAGAVLPSDVTQADLTLKSAELDLSAAEATLAAAYTDLSIALGVSVSGVASEVPDAQEPAVDDLVAAVAARDDVRAAQRDLASAADAVDQAVRASGVNVSANASVSATSGATSLSLGASLDSRDQTPSLTSRLATSTGGSSTGGAAWRASLGVSASVPLGPPDTRVASAELSYAQAQAKLEQTIASANVEVGALRVQVEADAAKVQVAEARSALAGDASAAADVRYGLGVVGQVEVVQARIASLQADGQLRSARFTHLLDLMALARALGRPATEVIR
ncbi:MAG: TolC family protein [Trueperaceae bacterium]|nr:TolC family protein [Trueperaceae bacterium]